MTSGICALICTLKPECCSGSLISIQSISLTSFFQPSSCWGDLRLDTSREMCQTRIERQLVYISQGCGNQIVRRPPRTAAWLQKAEVTVSVNDALWMIPTMFSRNSEYSVRIQRIECLFYCISYIPATIGGLKDYDLGLLLEMKVLVLSKPKPQQYPQPVRKLLPVEPINLSNSYKKCVYLRSNSDLAQEFYSLFLSLLGCTWKYYWNTSKLEPKNNKHGSCICFASQDNICLQQLACHPSNSFPFPPDATSRWAR